MGSAVGKQVLVVDDDRATLAALGDVLRDAGYSVRVAASADEALTSMNTEAALPDTMLVDLMMPGVDGWQLISRVRDDPNAAQIPIVVMTAGGTALLATAPVAAGYLLKPVDVQDLLDVLERVLALRALRASDRPSLA